jgi:hypothetical protein
VDAPEPAPGDTWRSKGQAGHLDYEVAVIKRTAGGGVVFKADRSASKRMRHRLHTMPLDKFLSQHTLVRSAHD